ncbi:hypothetical protein ACLOJK_012624 [Asimina triloba]
MSCTCLKPSIILLKNPCKPKSQSHVPHRSANQSMDPNTITLTTQHLVFALLLLVFCIISPSASSNSTTDQLSLIHFKSSITADPHRILDSWTPNNSFCNWTGIVCGPAHGHQQRVVALRLPGLSLSGNLSPHIANVSFLRYLDLQNNTLNGRIPSSLSSCSELLYLDLSRNAFEGLIPPELSSLQKLQVLTLERNRLTGPIPSSFGNLSSLDNLILLRNNLNGSIPAELGRLKRLRNLQVSSNRLTGEIPPPLFNLSSLKELKSNKQHADGSSPIRSLLQTA